MDPIQSAVLFILMTGISTYLLSFAYKNVKFILKHKYVLPIFYFFFCFVLESIVSYR